MHQSPMLCLHLDYKRKWYHLMLVSLWLFLSTYIFHCMLCLVFLFVGILFWDLWDEVMVKTLQGKRLDRGTCFHLSLTLMFAPFSTRKLQILSFPLSHAKWRWVYPIFPFLQVNQEASLLSAWSGFRWYSPPSQQETCTCPKFLMCRHGEEASIRSQPT